VIGAARNLYHRTMLMVLYSTGLRRVEMCRLRVKDVDSKRMMLRVEQGKAVSAVKFRSSETPSVSARVLPLDKIADLLVPRHG